MPLTRLLRLIAAIVVALGAGLAARAQVLVPRAYFYTEPGFQGECFTVEAGTNLENLEHILDSQGRPFNDRIHSIQLEGPIRLVVFRNADFRGESIWINGDVADLRGYAFAPGASGSWARNISSVQLQGVAGGVVVFARWDRRDAERVVRANYIDYLGREPDSVGLRHYTMYLTEGGWSEEQLREALHRSPEFRSRDVDAIIRREYREVLGRDPDESGMNTYRKALGRGMTITQMRADLQRSREGADKRARDAEKHIHDAVVRAYREILKREPDAPGLVSYTDLMQKGMSESDMREALRKSDEARNLRGR